MFSYIKKILFYNIRIREFIYKYKYGIDKNTTINNCYLSLKDFDRIKFDNCRLGDKGNYSKPIKINLSHNSEAIFGYKSFLREDVKIQLQGNSFFSLGDYSYLNWGTVVVGGGDSKIIIGKNCAIAWNVNLISYDFHCPIFDNNEYNYYGNITIHDNVWIGANVTVLKNVEIGENSIVAANSVVVKGKYPANSLIAGNPAKVVKTNVSWRHLTIKEKKGNK